MEYSVGSLSDLITGANTPNKPKVVKRHITPKTPSLETLDTPKSLKKKNKPPKVPEYDLGNNSIPEHIHEPKGKKKKHSINDTGSPPNKIKKLGNSDQDFTKKKQKDQSLKRKVPLDNNSFSVSHNQVVTKGETDEKPKGENETNAERRIRRKERVQNLTENPELLERTVFVGNLPIMIKTDKFKKFFTKYGPVESVRIRGIPVANPNTTKKVAVIKKEFHPKRKSLFGYVKFVEQESCEKACADDGILFGEHHLRIHMCNAEVKPDEAKAIFVGNLSFAAEEEELWKLFELCGEISSVRIVRDGRLGMGKGFGYVNFKTSDAVQLALQMEDVELDKRVLRISACNVGAAKKNRKKDKSKQINKVRKPKNRVHKHKPPTENGGEESTTIDNSEKIVNKSIGKQFQGSTFTDKKKKNKVNKGLLHKKKMIKKLAPKSSE